MASSRPRRVSGGRSALGRPAPDFFTRLDRLSGGTAARFGVRRLGDIRIGEAGEERSSSRLETLSLSSIPELEPRKGAETQEGLGPGRVIRDVRPRSHNRSS